MTTPIGLSTAQQWYEPGTNTPTTPSPGLPSAAPLPTVDQLTATLAAQQKQTGYLNAQLQVLQATLAKSKSAASKAAVQAKITSLQKTIATATKAQNDTQNSIYSATGQYDKLLSGTDRDAYMALDTLFQGYGLGTLAGKIYDYVKNGYSSDTISILLQDTPEYKARFAGNVARQKAGLPVLSPADYLSTEDSYRQIMRQAGLPTGFYDSTDDFTNFIGTDVSPTELQSRVDLASQATALANPAYKEALQQMGLDQGSITAYFLDPSASLPILQKQAATAAIGGEALQRGFNFDQQYAENLATEGVTQQQAASTYSQIGQQFNQLQTLGSIYGSAWTQRTAENAAFIGSAEATQQQAQLIGQEKAQFSGAAGGASTARGLAGAGGAR